VERDLESGITGGKTGKTILRRNDQLKIGKKVLKKKGKHD